MTTSQRGIDLIKKFEGLRLKAYKPIATEKYWTIGYGHYGSDVKAGMVITETYAEGLLKKDLARFEKHVSSYSAKYGWNQNEFDALVSFAFNIGSIDGLTKNGTRSREEIVSKWTSYCKAGGKTVDGLKRRRILEAELFLEVVKGLPSDPEVTGAIGLPPRGYYQIGDGINALKNYPTQIKRIQTALKRLGYYVGKIDGKYTGEVSLAVGAIQKANNLNVNGCVNKSTAAVLNKVL